MFPNLVNILKVDLKFLLFVRYHNVFCDEVTYKVVNCSYDIHDGDNDGDDGGGKCGEVTYEVVEGSDSQKPGGIISRRETGGELDDDVHHWLYFNSSWYLWNLSLKEMSEIHDIHEICGHGGGRGDMRHWLFSIPPLCLRTWAGVNSSCRRLLFYKLFLMPTWMLKAYLESLSGNPEKVSRARPSEPIFSQGSFLRKQVGSIERQNQKNEPVS